MSKLVCKDFSVKYFGYDAAINSVSTTFLDGLNVLFAGEKSGKTTFLKAIAGIIPYEGELYLDDVKVRDIPLRERDIQMLFDDYSLFLRHSVRYNLEYPLKLRKVPQQDRRKAVDEVAALFDLEYMLEAPVYRLNEWLKVCLCLCRAYLRKPKVLLIDNIFSKLSLPERSEAFHRFMPLVNEGIVIYATDSRTEASELSRDIKFMSCGYLTQEGTPEDFSKAPLTLAAFSAWEEYPSLLPCFITDNGVIIEGELCEQSLSLKSDLYLGKEAIAAVAANDVTLSANGFKAIVCGKFYSGEKKVYSAKTSDFSVYFISDKELLMQSEVTLSVRRLIAVFDAFNERRISEVIQ